MHTIVLLLVAALGWMSSAPTTGLTRVATADTFGGTFARYLLLPALLLPVFFSFAFEALQSWYGASKAVAFALSASFTGGTVACLVWWVATLLDQVERQRRESTLLRDDASTDVLTGLSNRRGFDNALAELLDGHREHDAVFSLLMIDLDRFKAYNDDFGHQEGDEALRIAGRILRTVLRHGDLAARYGGEEFALVLQGADVTRANMTAQRILNGFRAYQWPLRAVTASIGVAQARPNDGVQDIVRRADSALYNAKNAGRDQAAADSDFRKRPAQRVFVHS
jgi:diguanylate cyclase (GGDEF)-like protein